MKSKDFNFSAGLSKVVINYRITKIIIAVFMAACFFNLSLPAAYLKNIPQTITQPDGTILNCFATGDEFHHWLHDANNFTIVQDSVTGFYVYAMKSGNKLVPTSYVAGKTDPTLTNLQAGVNLEEQDVQLLRKGMFRVPALKGGSTATTTGTLNNIVIFIRFSDQAEFSDAIASYGQAFNATGSVSMVEYFKEVSGSQLTINTSLFPQTGGSTVVSYQDPMARNYYSKYNAVTNTAGYQNETERSTREMTLLKDATESVKSQIESTGLDFDNDDNGQIDNICYIIQGSTDGWAELLWPHMWALYAFDVTINGATVWNYNFQLSQTFGVSVLCHEMSHSLGFPDLYRYSNRTINPVGPWDLMASTTNPPQHQSVYLKQKYGKWFSSIPEITANGTYTLSPLSSNPFAGYKISSPNSTTEYFMVEYRKTAGRFESQLLGSGLIIYRVAPANTGNSFGPPDEVYVLRPNGTTTVDGSLAQAFFSSNAGRTSCGSTSNPTCFLSNGSFAGIQITNIGTAGETITFTVSFGNETPSVMAIAPVSREVAAAAGTATFAVSNTGGGTMSWSSAVTTGSNWAHITAGASGSNAGSITVSADANTESVPRTAVITVTSTGANGSPMTLNVTQAANGPVLSITPGSRNLGFGSGTATFAVSNTGGGIMSWSSAVTTGSNWAHITAGASGSNAGSITVSADANTESAPRTAVITVTASDAAGSPKTLTITQAANGSVLSITPGSRSLGFGSGTATFDVSNTGGGTMSWSAAVTSGSNWAQITDGASGSNAGSITVSADANTESAPRTAVITVTASDAAGSPKTLTITQAANGSVLSITPGSRSLGFGSGNATFDVSNTGGGTMSWSAAVTSGGNWAQITDGASGSNAGSITVSADANTESTPRTAVITVTAGDAAGSPKTLTITQAANGSVLSITPGSRNLGFGSANATFDVSNTGGGTMSWSAAVTSGSNWAQITDGASGSNAGSVQVSIEANTESTPRTAVITVTAGDAAGSPKTLTITQAAKEPVMFVSPGNQSVAFDGATTTFDVSNIGGGNMSWTSAVTSGSEWAHITSGLSGNDSGTIMVSVDANPDNNLREASVTVTRAGADGHPQVLRITQDANLPVLIVDLASKNLDSKGGIANFSVSKTGGGTVRWTSSVTSGGSWAKIISGSDGSNAGTVSVDVEANYGRERTASITITADDVNGTSMAVSIVQAAQQAILEIDPDLQTVAYEGANVNFGVSAIGFGTINWSAEVTTGPSWARIISGTEGSNDGQITVEVDANGGERRTAVITVTSADSTASPKTLTIVQDISNGINSLQTENKINVYPNPVNKQCTVQIEEFSGMDSRLEVFNMMGQLESVQSLNQERTQVDMSDLHQGVYLFRVSTENTILSQRRVVKN